MTTRQLCDAITGKVLNIQEPEFEKPVEYPSDKFKVQGYKPSIKIRGINASLVQLRAGVFAFIKGDKVAPSCVTHYLYTIMKTVISDDMHEDWNSYSVSIPKGIVHPTDLAIIEVDKSTPWKDLPVPELLDEKADEYLMFTLVCMYRYMNAHEKQRDSLNERIKVFLSQTRVDNSHPTSLSASNTNISIIGSNPQIDFLMGCLDMFFVKFPKNPYAKLRFGTIVTRYQGCSGYSNLIHLKKIIGVPHLSYVIEWFFCPQILKEIEQMLSDHPEEWTVTNSYLPYMMSMLISERSPYSANNNPATHALVHLVGTLLGSGRSRNAIFPDNIGCIPIAVNAAVIFFAHKHMIGLRPLYVTPETRANLQATKTSIERMDYDMDSEKLVAETPLEWYEIFKSRDFKFESEEIKEIDTILSKIEEPRSGTAAEWASKNLVSMLSSSAQKDK
ncbi:nucleocapsid [Mononegavirales sp.]|nr:nucleocapsid [Mononegavirales sp.]